jgi:hypothetical protein
MGFALIESLAYIFKEIFVFGGGENWICHKKPPGLKISPNILYGPERSPKDVFVWRIAYQYSISVENASLIAVKSRRVVFVDTRNSSWYHSVFGGEVIVTNMFTSRMDEATYTETIGKFNICTYVVQIDSLLRRNKCSLFLGSHRGRHKFQATNKPQPR